MKKKLMIGLCLSLWAISGCQQGNSTTTQPKESTETIEASEKQEVITEEEKYKNLFLQQLVIGMTEEEIRTLFGTQFTLVENTMEGNETWRFDLGTSPDYEFQDQGIDQVDMEGLKAGKVKQQLFIDWDDRGTVLSAALFWVDSKQQVMYEYHLLSDGTREEKKNTL